MLAVKAKLLLQIVASIALHLLVISFMMLCSSKQASSDEKIYHVTLAEFTRPASFQAPVSVESDPPEQELQQPKPPQSEPSEGKPEKQVEKKISSDKKKATLSKKNLARPSQFKPSGTPGQTMSNSTARSVRTPSTVGGLLAYDIDAVDQRPTVLKRIQPEYPTRARRMNTEGKVLVSLVVNTSGIAVECKVINAQPTGYFEESAIEAAKRTKFIPGKMQGKPVNTLVVIPYSFRLR